jgi:hypothetical protein
LRTFRTGVIPCGSTPWAELSSGNFQSVSGTETAAGQGQAFGVLAEGSL